MTVLHRLKKFKHPNVKRMWDDKKFYKSHSTVHLSTGVEFNYMNTNNEDSLLIVFKFKNNKEEYSFSIKEDNYEFMVEYFDPKSLGYNLLEEFYSNVLQYGNIEETVFQLTTVGRLGMIGTQEIEMIHDIHDIYFKG